MNVPQVRDDPELLDLMLSDMAAAPALYQPTNYWRSYVARGVAELRAIGLRDFRRRRDSVLGSFGATDIFPWVYRRKPRHAGHPVASVAKAMIELLADCSWGPVRTAMRYAALAVAGADDEDLLTACYEAARAAGEAAGARPLEAWTSSRVGNPDAVFVRDGREYTLIGLYYYAMYAHAARRIDFPKASHYAEIGSGAGRQVELLRALFPTMRFLLFDIPPQLYVCERYLASLYPDSVISYRETRAWKTLPALPPGAIAILGSSRLPEISGLGWDVFWSSASFGEMEPDVVLNYLGFVDRATRKSVFLHQRMAGKELAAEGGHGVLVPTTLAHYRQGLPGFELVDEVRNAFPTLAGRGYSFATWTRRAPS